MPRSGIWPRLSRRSFTSLKRPVNASSAHGSWTRTTRTSPFCTFHWSAWSRRGRKPPGRPCVNTKRRSCWNQTMTRSSRAWETSISTNWRCRSGLRNSTAKRWRSIRPTAITSSGCGRSCRREIFSSARFACRFQGRPLLSTCCVPLRSNRGSSCAFWWASSWCSPISPGCSPPPSSLDRRL